MATEDSVRLFFQWVGDGLIAAIVPNALFMFEDFRRLANGRTLVFIDWRNRGRSDHGGDPQTLRRAIHRDADDLEAVRRHFQFQKVREQRR